MRVLLHCIHDILEGKSEFNYSFIPLLDSTELSFPHLFAHSLILQTFTEHLIS